MHHKQHLLDGPIKKPSLREKERYLIALHYSTI